MLNSYQIILSIVFLKLLVGCNSYTPPIKGNQYTIKECQQELLESNDYVQNEGIDLIVIKKKERKMYLYSDDKIQRVIPISLGKNPKDAKERRGDNRTPEGTFWISRKLCSSKYYRSLCISYPLPEDRKKALKRGLNPGGSITIHAQPVWNADGKGDSYTLGENWTQGCVAVTNTVMHELWYVVREGTVVIIR